MSDSQLVGLRSTPSEPEAPGIASRAIEVNGVRWALVEYEPSVLREEWCLEGHSGFVIEGEMTYEFEDRDELLELRPGDAFSLADDDAHRGRAGENGAKLFVIDHQI